MLQLAGPGTVAGPPVISGCAFGAAHLARALGQPVAVRLLAIFFSSRSTALALWSFLA